MAHRDRSRGSEVDVQRAVQAARNPRESKFGECLLNLNTRQDPVLRSRLQGISAEMKRMEFRMHQLKQHFVKTNPCLNHEPLILVERSASTKVKARAKVIEEGGEDPDDRKKPGYMRPLKSRSRTPSTLTTIDAFTLRARKKRNVWEEATDEGGSASFRSAVRPCVRLTAPEVATLRLGWDAHKPKVDPSTGACSTVARPPSAKKKQRQPQRALATASAEGSVFITQLPRKDLAKTPDGRLLENAFLDQLLSVNSLKSSGHRRDDSGSSRNDGSGQPPLDQQQSSGAVSASEASDRVNGLPRKGVFLTRAESSRMAVLYSTASSEDGPSSCTPRPVEVGAAASESTPAQRASSGSPPALDLSLARSHPRSPSPPQPGEDRASSCTAVVLVATPSSSSAGMLLGRRNGSSANPATPATSEQQQRETVVVEV